MNGVVFTPPKFKVVINHLCITWLISSFGL